jgi:DNA helicase-2/ATP-dependent DNA helicase PcrA
VSPESVRAAFHYVRSGRTVEPDTLPDAVELARLLEAA